MIRRSTLGWAAATAALWAAGGCASRSEPTRWYELRTEPPEPPRAPPRDSGEVWEVTRRVHLPGALDRDSLQRASGQASLEPLVGHRWAAPLRDAVPRLLLHDLALLRGSGRVWAAPAPAGVVVDRRLQVELLTLQAAAGRRALQLQAVWWLDAVAAPAPPRAEADTDTLTRPPAGTAARAKAPAGTPAPQPRRVDLEVALADDSIDTLAAAHRVALWRLAERIASEG